MKTSPAQQTIVDRCNCMANPAAIQQAEKVPVRGERFLQIAERGADAAGREVASMREALEATIRFSGIENEGTRK